MDAVRHFCERVFARVSSETKVCQPNIEFTRLRRSYEQCFRFAAGHRPAPRAAPHRHPPSHGTYALAAASLLPFLQYLWLRRNLGSMPLVDLFACFLGFLMPEQGDGKDQRSEEGLNCTEAGVRKP